jgi:tripartite-type tricarboxylate transporter receptor subunit TctC
MHDARRRKLCCIIATAALFPADLAFAQAYPAKPVKLVVPFPAGGTVDLVGRAVGNFLSSDLDRQFIVENLPGAGSIVGTQVVSKSLADGYTVCLSYLSHVAAPLFVKTAYDPVKDFRAASVFAWGRSVAVVPTSSSIKSLQDLVAAAKANPGKLNYLNPGNGTLAHLSTELLKLNTGANIQSVSYKGLPPAMTDLLNGTLDFAMLSFPFPDAFFKDGKLRAIAMLADERDPQFPDVPTYREQGFASSSLKTWYALLLPARTPDAIVARLNGAMNRLLDSDSAREKLTTLSLTPAAPSTPAAADHIIAEDAKRIADLVRRAGIKIQ